MKWVHIDIWFSDVCFRSGKYRSNRYLTPQEQIEFRHIVATFIRRCKPYINRKFFLYEDIPHCFIALEVKNPQDLKKISQWCKIYLKAPFIYKAYLNERAGDLGNGQGFLNVLNAMADFYLFHRDNKLTHIIHCCLEFMMGSRKEENQFYKNMSLCYNDKIRKITFAQRKKLLQFIDSYNFERN